MTSHSLRERGKQQRIDRILKAGIELLREDPSSLRLERVAERAEVAPMTVFNLVGNRDQLWAAMIDHTLVGLDFGALRAREPHERARGIVDAVTRTLCGDDVAFRALLAGWSRSVPILHDPTNELVACFQSALEAGGSAPALSARRLGELVSTGLRGAIHQWAAGEISDRTFRRRARDMVDVAFGYFEQSAVTRG